jgi:MoaA/NifB/PqqE/SkfB family radical SAM enzyme
MIKNVVKETLNRFPQLIPSNLPWKPIGYNFWLTTNCNLHCKLCYRSTNKIAKNEMELEVFKKIMKNIKNKEIGFCGNGETLIHPHIFEFMEIAKKNNCKVSFFTNGTLLTEDVSRQIINLGADNMAISIDGTGKTYEKMRHLKFDFVFNNVKNFVELQKKLKKDKPNLSISFVGVKDNIEDFPNLINTFSPYINFFRFLHVQPYNKQIDKKHLHNYPKLTGRVLEKSKAISNSLNLQLRLRPVKPLPEFCREPFFTPYITYDGSVYPCCILGDHHDLKATEWYMGIPTELNPGNCGLMGNLLDEPIENIWNNDKFVNLRKNLLNSVKSNKKESWSVEKYKQIRKQKMFVCDNCAFRFSCVC